MGRKKRLRILKRAPKRRFFAPGQWMPANSQEDIITLGFDEMEAMRLRHIEGMRQNQCADEMNVSQPTFSRILKRAHKKVTEALVRGIPFRVEGGAVGVSQSIQGYGCVSCMYEWYPGLEVSDDGQSLLHESGEIIAVDENVAKQFGWIQGETPAQPQRRRRRRGQPEFARVPLQDIPESVLLGADGEEIEIPEGDQTDACPRCGSSQVYQLKRDALVGIE